MVALGYVVALTLLGAAAAARSRRSNVFPGAGMWQIDVPVTARIPLIRITMLGLLPAARTSISSDIAAPVVVCFALDSGASILPRSV